MKFVRSNSFLSDFLLCFVPEKVSVTRWLCSKHICRGIVAKKPIAIIKSASCHRPVWVPEAEEIGVRLRGSRHISR